MLHQRHQLEISDVRAVARQVVNGQPLPPDVTQTAADSFREMCREAAGHGLSTADVVRAVLSPILKKRRGCDCYTCTTRRSTNLNETNRRLNKALM